RAPGLIVQCTDEVGDFPRGDSFDPDLADDRVEGFVDPSAGIEQRTGKTSPSAASGSSGRLRPTVLPGSSSETRSGVWTGRRCAHSVPRRSWRWPRLR